MTATLVNSVATATSEQISQGVVRRMLNPASAIISQAVATTSAIRAAPSSVSMS